MPASTSPASAAAAWKPDRSRPLANVAPWRAMAIDGSVSPTVLKRR